MPIPEFSFPERKMYIDQQQYRIRSREIREDQIYTAISLLESAFLNHEAVAFPVRFESIAFPVSLSKNPMAAIAMQMTLLDQDFHHIEGSTTQGFIQDGVWKVANPILVENSSKPINRGYLLYSLPGEPFADDARTYGTSDPRSIY